MVSGDGFESISLAPPEDGSEFHIDEATGTPQGGSDPIGDAVGSALGVVTGIGALDDILRAAEAIAPQLLKVLQSEAKSNVFANFSLLHEFASFAESFFNRDGILSWKWVSQHSIGAFFTEMLHLGLSVDVGAFDDNAKKGVETVDTMLGFAAMLPFIMSSIESIGKAIFANRWPEFATEVLAKLPEEMGISWAMGLTIDEAFKVALGSSLTEGINRQKRGNRIEWPVLRTMLRQHIFEGIEYKPRDDKFGYKGPINANKGEHLLADLLSNQGFPDEQIGWLLQLKDAVLPVGDIANLYQSEIIGEPEVLKALEENGFDAATVKWLKELYIDKADTQAGSVLRSTFRSLFRLNLITEEMYRDKLGETHFPKREIDDDINAIKAEHTYGRMQASASVIKQQLLHHVIKADTAILKLQQIGYAHESALDMVNTWQLPTIPHAHMITVSQVLGYYVSGVLNTDQATDRLRELNVREDDIKFLLAHPTTHSGVHVHPLSASLVTTAYVHDIIKQADLAPLYEKAGIAKENIGYYVSEAEYKYAHRRPVVPPTEQLTKGEILQAYKYGIYSLEVAITHLEQLGLSHDTAFVLLEIESHGTIDTRPAPPPIFANVEQALEYLLARGFRIEAPPDAILQAAESMAAQAGYGVIPPPTPPAYWTPPPGWKPPGPHELTGETTGEAPTAQQ